MSMRYGFTSLKILLLFVVPLYAGFEKKSIIHTSDGPREAQKLNLGTIVYCYNDKYRIAKKPITWILKRTVNKVVKIHAENGETIIVAPGTRIYIAQEKQWIPAEYIDTHHSLLRQDMSMVKVKNVQQSDQETEIVDFEVEKHHNFWVTSNAFLVHNMHSVVIGLGEVILDSAVKTCAEYLFGKSVDRQIDAVKHAVKNIVLKYKNKKPDSRVPNEHLFTTSDKSDNKSSHKDTTFSYQKTDTRSNQYHDNPYKPVEQFLNDYKNCSKSEQERVSKKYQQALINIRLAKKYRSVGMSVLEEYDSELKMDVPIIYSTQEEIYQSLLKNQELINENLKKMVLKNGGTYEEIIIGERKIIIVKPAELPTLENNNSISDKKEILIPLKTPIIKENKVYKFKIPTKGISIENVLFHFQSKQAAFKYKDIYSGKVVSPLQNFGLKNSSALLKLEHNKGSDLKNENVENNKNESYKNDVNIQKKELYNFKNISLQNHKKHANNVVISPPIPNNSNGFFANVARVGQIADFTVNLVNHIKHEQKIKQGRKEHEKLRHTMRCSVEEEYEKSGRYLNDKHTKCLDEVFLSNNIKVTNKQRLNIQKECAVNLKVSNHDYPDIDYFEEHFKQYHGDYNSAENHDKVESLRDLAVSALQRKDFLNRQKELDRDSSWTKAFKQRFYDLEKALWDYCWKDTQENIKKRNQEWDERVKQEEFQRIKALELEQQEKIEIARQQRNQILKFYAKKFLVRCAIFLLMKAINSRLVQEYKAKALRKFGEIGERIFFYTIFYTIYIPIQCFKYSMESLFQRADNKKTSTQECKPIITQDETLVNPITESENETIVTPIKETSDETLITPINVSNDETLTTPIEKDKDEKLITTIDSLDNEPLIKEIKAKTVEDILEGAQPGEETNGPSTIFIKPGGSDGFKAANDDFDALQPLDVEERPNSIRVGILPNGDTVVVRPKSSGKKVPFGKPSGDGEPTLEIQHLDPETGKKSILRTKIRYTKE